MKDVIINGITYQGKNRVQLTTVGGGTALFRDESEIAGMESGTITPAEDSMAIEIPVSSKKTHVIITTPIAAAVAAAIAIRNICVVAIEGDGCSFTTTNANGTSTQGYAKSESEYTAEGESKPVYVAFEDNRIYIKISTPTNLQRFAAGWAYSWVAW